MTLRTPVVWIALFAIAGCTVTEPARRTFLRSWVGYHYLDVLATVGRPLEVYSDGLTGRVLVFREITDLPPTERTQIPDDSISVFESIVWDSELAGRTPSTYVVASFDQLYVDKDGYVYSFQSNESDREIRHKFESQAVIIGVASVFVGILVLIIAAEDDDSY